MGERRSAVCGLTAYGSELQADLAELAALDPAAVAEPGSEAQAAALAAVDALDQTVANAQEALDNATGDQVGSVVRTLFQAALDATTLATDALRSCHRIG